MKKKSRTTLLLLFAIVLIPCLFLTACDELDKENTENGSNTHSSSDFTTQAGSGDPLKIVAGSEMKVLEPIFETYAKESGKRIAIDYLGSLDIMRLLDNKDNPYDAVWPASLLWLNMGDKNHVLKHMETIAVTPVIFGIRASLAKELGLADRNDVTMAEIEKCISDGKLKFAMTSATQSNSGASAYLAFLTALSDTPKDGISKEDLENPKLQERITKFLTGVNRSSGSSNWLVDLFLKGGFDAMVNYEQLIIQTNQQLVAKGQEPLTAIYPVDGISLSDSPLAYVDKGNEKKEKDFLDFQNYLLSNAGQAQIERTGKRNAFGKVSKQNQGLYKKEWGIQPDRLLAPIRLPQNAVITQALDLYQTSFKKPAYTIYVLDYSGSMRGVGYNAMMYALQEILLPENAKKDLLLGTSKDKTVLVPFASYVHREKEAIGSDQTELYNYAKDFQPRGGTSLYEALDYAMDYYAKHAELLQNYIPAIVLMTDGQANGSMTFEDFNRSYEEKNLGIPIFPILFGSADEDEMKRLAELTKARTFDGRENLIQAFRAVKGYN